MKMTDLPSDVRDDLVHIRRLSASTMTIAFAAIYLALSIPRLRIDFAADATKMINDQALIAGLAKNPQAVFALFHERPLARQLQDGAKEALAPILKSKDWTLFEPVDSSDSDGNDRVDSWLPTAIDIEPVLTPSTPCEPTGELVQGAYQSTIGCAWKMSIPRAGDVVAVDQGSLDGLPYGGNVRIVSFRPMATPSSRALPVQIEIEHQKIATDGGQTRVFTQLFKIEATWALNQTEHLATDSEWFTARYPAIGRHLKFVASQQLRDLRDQNTPLRQAGRVAPIIKVMGIDIEAGSFGIAAPLALALALLHQIVYVAALTRRARTSSATLEPLRQIGDYSPWIGAMRGWLPSVVSIASTVVAPGAACWMCLTYAVGGPAWMVGAATGAVCALGCIVVIQGYRSKDIYVGEEDAPSRF